MIDIQSILNPKKLFFLIFTGYFIIAMHIFIPNMGGYGLYLPYNIIGWMFIAILIGLGFWQISKTGQIQFSKIQIIYWGAFLLLLIPFFYPNNEFASRAIYRIMFILGGLLFYTSLYQFKLNKTDRIFLLYIILIAILIQSLIGLIQYYGIGSENFFLIEKKAMPFGSFQQRNVMASFMASGIGISLFLIIRDRNILASRLKTGLVFLVSFKASILIAALTSNTGFIGLFFSLIFLLPKVNLRKKVYQRFGSLVLIGLLVGWLSPQIAPKLDLETRSTENRVHSGKVRLSIYETTFQIWKNNPILGVGYGHFSKVCREYLASRHANESDFEDYGALTGRWDHPHNELLLWASEGGIIPLIGILIMAGAYLIMIFRIHWKEAFTFLAILMPILIHTQVEYPFYHSLAHWIIFLTLLYIADAEVGVKLTHNYGLHKLMIIPAVLIPLFVMKNMANTLDTLYVLTDFDRSGMKDYNLVTKIKKPGALHLKYDDAILKSLFDIGLETHNEKTLNLFLVEAKSFIKHTHLLHVYYAMSAALSALEREDEAQAIMDRIHYLFPKSELTTLE